MSRPPPNHHRNHQRGPPVEDLRCKLNRLREEREQGNAAPPDPTYNFLRDPARDEQSGRTTRVFHKRPNEPWDREWRQGKPYNIKVELETGTGQRMYTMDNCETFNYRGGDRGRPHRGRGYFRRRGRGFRGNSNNQQARNEVTDEDLQLKQEEFRSNEVEYNLGGNEHKRTSNRGDEINNMDLINEGDCEEQSKLKYTSIEEDNAQKQIQGNHCDVQFKQKFPKNKHFAKKHLQREISSYDNESKHNKNDVKQNSGEIEQPQHRQSRGYRNRPSTSDIEHNSDEPSKDNQKEFEITVNFSNEGDHTDEQLKERQIKRVYRGVYRRNKTSTNDIGRNSGGTDEQQKPKKNFHTKHQPFKDNQHNMAQQRNNYDITEVPLESTLDSIDEQFKSSRKYENNNEKNKYKTANKKSVAAQQESEHGLENTDEINKSNNKIYDTRRSHSDDPDDNYANIGCADEKSKHKSPKQKEGDCDEQLQHRHTKNKRYDNRRTHHENSYDNSSRSDAKSSQKSSKQKVLEMQQGSVEKNRHKPSNIKTNEHSYDNISSVDEISKDKSPKIKEVIVAHSLEDTDEHSKHTQSKSHKYNKKVHHESSYDNLSSADERTKQKSPKIKMVGEPSKFKQAKNKKYDSRKVHYENSAKNSQDENEHDAEKQKQLQNKQFDSRRVRHENTNDIGEHSKNKNQDKFNTDVQSIQQDLEDTNKTKLHNKNTESDNTETTIETLEIYASHGNQTIEDGEATNDPCESYDKHEGDYYDDEGVYQEGDDDLYNDYYLETNYVNEFDC